MSEKKTIYGESYPQVRPERRKLTRQYEIWECAKNWKIYVRFRCIPESRTVQALKNIGFTWNAESKQMERYRSLYGFWAAQRILEKNEP